MLMTAMTAQISTIRTTWAVLTELVLVIRDAWNDPRSSTALASIHRANCCGHFPVMRSGGRDLAVFSGVFCLPLTGSAACPGALLGVSGGVMPGGAGPLRGAVTGSGLVRPPGRAGRRRLRTGLAIGSRGAGTAAGAGSAGCGRGGRGGRRRRSGRRGWWRRGPWRGTGRPGTRPRAAGCRRSRRRSATRHSRIMRQSHLASALLNWPAGASDTPIVPVQGALSGLPHRAGTSIARWIQAKLGREHDHHCARIYV